LSRVLYDLIDLETLEFEGLKGSSLSSELDRLHMKELHIHTFTLSDPHRLTFHELKRLLLALPRCTLQNLTIWSVECVVQREAVDGRRKVEDASGSWREICVLLQDQHVFQQLISLRLGYLREARKDLHFEVQTPDGSPFSKWKSEDGTHVAEFKGAAVEMNGQLAVAEGMRLLLQCPGLRPVT
jgi:hypothetical protein